MIHQPDGRRRGTGIRYRDSCQGDTEGQEELYEIIALHTGKTVEKVEKDSDRDYWMTAAEAKEYGMIDEVLIRNTKTNYTPDG
jgi:ATP-dependent Clp protease protease subunit